MLAWCVLAKFDQTPILTCVSLSQRSRRCGRRRNPSARDCVNGCWGFRLHQSSQAFCRIESSAQSKVTPATVDLFQCAHRRERHRKKRRTLVEKCVIQSRVNYIINNPGLEIMQRIGCDCGRIAIMRLAYYRNGRIRKTYRPKVAATLNTAFNWQAFGSNRSSHPKKATPQWSHKNSIGYSILQSKPLMELPKFTLAHLW